MGIMYLRIHPSGLDTTKIIIIYSNIKQDKTNQNQNHCYPGGHSNLIYYCPIVHDTGASSTPQSMNQVLVNLKARDCNIPQSTIYKCAKLGEIHSNVIYNKSDSPRM